MNLNARHHATKGGGKNPKRNNASYLQDNLGNESASLAESFDFSQ